MLSSSVSIVKLSPIFLFLNLQNASSTKHSLAFCGILPSSKVTVFTLSNDNTFVTISVSS